MLIAAVHGACWSESENQKQPPDRRDDQLADGGAGGTVDAGFETLFENVPFASVDLEALAVTEPGLAAWIDSVDDKLVSVDVADQLLVSISGSGVIASVMGPIPDGAQEGTPLPVLVTAGHVARLPDEGHRLDDDTKFVAYPYELPLTPPPTEAAISFRIPGSVEAVSAERLYTPPFAFDASLIPQFAYPDIPTSSDFTFAVPSSWSGDTADNWGSPTEGEPVLLLGLPARSLHMAAGRVTRWQGNALSEVFAVDSAVQPEMSGGAAFDVDGNLLGIIVRANDELTVVVPMIKMTTGLAQDWTTRLGGAHVDLYRRIVDKSVP